MTLTTKFDPGQEVWFMAHTSNRHDLPKEPCKGVVYCFRVHWMPDGINVFYMVENIWRPQYTLFSSKSELLASL